MQKIITSGWIAIAAILSFSAHAEGTFNLSIGSEYTSGKYGTATSTSVWFFPVTTSYRQDSTSFSLTVPYVRITGAGGVIGAIGNQFQMNGGTSGGTNGSRRTTAGLGDVVLSATQNIYTNTEQDWAIDLAGNIKFGTADSTKGLGTGKNDYSVQADFSKYFEDTDLFGTIGWRMMGDPAGINFKNPWFTSVGAGYSLSQTTRIGLAYDFRQSLIDGTANFSELLAFINYNLSDQSRIQLYLLKGYTDNSPDLGMGAMLNLSY
ncbi:hypothetical protein [Ferrigenium sp. UT5]|uniref:hypothetical protein n=1 Tax=Ferrigenium sp. UT5 TaxID=3242105 RepID=UPI00355465DC